MSIHIHTMNSIRTYVTKCVSGLGVLTDIGRVNLPEDLMAAGLKQYIKYYNSYFTDVFVCVCVEVAVVMVARVCVCGCVGGSSSGSGSGGIIYITLHYYGV